MSMVFIMLTKNRTVKNIQAIKYILQGKPIISKVYGFPVNKTGAWQGQYKIRTIACKFILNHDLDVTNFQYHDENTCVYTDQSLK
jgi:hypothetical protein